MSSRRRFLIAATVGTLGLLAAGASAQTERGFLSVTATPPARAALTDDKGGSTDIGATPIQNHQLAAGTYKLTLVSLDGKHKRTLGFTIKSGQHTKLRVSLGD